MNRLNAVIVDEAGIITHTVVKLRMLHDLIEATYICSQSIENSIMSTSSIGVMNEGKDRLFMYTESGNRSELRQILNPRTYEELEVTRNIVRAFNCD